MPGFAYWNGSIPAGAVSRMMVSSLDVFATVIRRAGGELPTDRELDGEDMTQLLLAETDEAFEAAHGGPLHECLSFYGGSTGAGCSRAATASAAAKACPGLWAVRCGSLKAHWVTRHTNWTWPGEQLEGPTLHTPPLLFNLDADPMEQRPISAQSELYRRAMPRLEQERTRMEQSVAYEDIVNQVQLGSREQYVVCCDPWSEVRWPQYPACTCNPENWHQFVCEPICLGLGTCM